MATRRDYKIIDEIRVAKQEAKEYGKDIAHELSAGEFYYESAIKSVRRACLATIICPLIIMALITLLCLYSIFVYDDADNTSAAVEILINAWFSYGVFSALPVPLAVWSRGLHTTPTFILISLIIMLIYSLLWGLTLIPVIAIVMNIIALTKWGTYRDWFYNIETEK